MIFTSAVKIGVKWLDVGASEIEFHKPLVKIQEQRNNQWRQLYLNGEPINDEGCDIEVRYLDEKNDGMAEYEARWYNPIMGGRYRFMIEARKNQSPIYSKIFLYSVENNLKTKKPQPFSKLPPQYLTDTQFE